MADIHILCRLIDRPIDQSYVEKITKQLRFGYPATYTVEEALSYMNNWGEDMATSNTTPLHLLCSHVPHNASKEELKVVSDMVTILFEHGAGWNLLDANGETPGCILLRRNLRHLDIYEKVVDGGVRAELLFRTMNKLLTSEEGGEEEAEEGEDGEEQREEGEEQREEGEEQREDDGETKQKSEQKEIDKKEHEERLKYLVKLAQKELQQIDKSAPDTHSQARRGSEPIEMEDDLEKYLEPFQHVDISFPTRENLTPLGSPLGFSNNRVVETDSEKEFAQGPGPVVSESEDEESLKKEITNVENEKPQQPDNLEAVKGPLHREKTSFSAVVQSRDPDVLEEGELADNEGTSQQMEILTQEQIQPSGSVDTEKAQNIIEEDMGVVDPSYNQSAYLQTKLLYRDGALVTEDSDDAVMMDWEAYLMVMACETIFKSNIMNNGEVDPEINVLNVGFGMGIVDTFISMKEPTKHYICEAHPDVLKKMKEDGWYDKPNVVVLEGRWQDQLSKLFEQGVFFNGMYFDTFSEHYSDMLDFFDYAVGLLKPHGVLSFFNGLGADREVVYDVYKKIVELDMADYGLKVQYENLEVPKEVFEPSEGNVWDGVRRPYWKCPTFYHPEIRFAFKID